ncbi:MAG: hypothetical protein ABL957_04820 [Parvularculaceae bacterium]
MKSTLIAAFVAPSIALTAVGIESSTPVADRAYGASVGEFSVEEARAHADATFARADLDRSQSLEADEYVALEIVTAELSRLNGFIALAPDSRGDVVALPIRKLAALTGGERARVEAVARGEFYAAAGSDALLSLGEYAGERSARFSAADRNGNGRLAHGELSSFAAREALFSRVSA